MNRHDIPMLRAQESYPSLSIFVRTHRAMPAREQDPITVKNLVKEAKERLLKEFSARELEALFAKIDESVVKIDYARSKDGIAIFVNANVSKVFRLPVSVESRVIIDKVFALGEIDRIVHRLVQYYLLLLNEKSVRLYSGVGSILHEISDGGFPLSYERPRVETMQYKVNNEIVRHSPHDSEYFDEHKRQFMRKVDEACKVATKDRPLPLIITGADRTMSFFKEVHKQPIAAEVSGDFELYSIFDLADAIEPATKKLWEEKQKNKLAEFDQAVGKLHHAFGIRAVWKMAQEGRIKDLLVEEGYAVPGAINKADSTNIMLASDSTLPGISDDLVDLVVAKVVEQGGSITFVDQDKLRGYEQIAAILRF
ncbi:TPA: hypothetical protein DCW54_01595 [Candidatus Dependentiae bacterium]|nr:hypothetical protein [Candidatus Dependentiae bacterium]